MNTKKLLRKLKKIFKKGKYYAVCNSNGNITFGKLAEDAEPEQQSVSHIGIYLEICFGWWHLADANTTPLYQINQPSFGFKSDCYSDNPDDEYYTQIKEISVEDFYKKYQLVKTALSLKKELESGVFGS